MRGRSIRISIFVVIILAIAISALAFSNINFKIPGMSEFQRGSTGPLGLKLGLDLRGGAHLVYQADIGTKILATLPSSIQESGVLESLEQMDIEPISAIARNSNTIQIKTRLLNEEERQSVRQALEDKYGVIDDENHFNVTDTIAPTADQMVGVLDIIGRRVNLLGTDEPIVQQFGDDRIIVQLPGAGGSIIDVEFVDNADFSDINNTLELAGYKNFDIEQKTERKYRIKTNSLSLIRQQDLYSEFTDAIGDHKSFSVTGGIEEAKSLIGNTASLTFKLRDCTDPICETYRDSDLGLTGDDLQEAYASSNTTTGEWAVNIQFDSRGADIFSDLTKDIVNDTSKRIAVFLDNDLLTDPVARAWIRDGRSQITGNFNRQSAQTLAIQLQSGRLPVPLTLIQESEVDALLGSKSLRKSLFAGLIGLGLVVIFMLLYYRVSGLVASLALIFYGVVVLAIFKLIPVTLTLPHLGGFILSIGLAVDANILIFERMKEEIRVGRTLASSVEVGFGRAWPAIRDGNVSTIITCAVLLWFGSRLGGGLINGFALSLLIGVLVSMFTAVVVSRNLLHLLAWFGLTRHTNLFSPEKIHRTIQGPNRSQTNSGGK